MAENLEDALRDGLAEDRPWMPEAILAREVVRLRSELSQAKADLAVEREGKCDWHLPSCHAYVLKLETRADRAEAALAERERVIRAEVWEEAANIAEKQALRGRLVYAGDFRAKAKALRALIPPQGEKPKEDVCGCGHDLVHHMNVKSDRTACGGDFPGGAKCGCFGWNPNPAKGGQ